MSREEQARAKAQIEKDKAQSEVDAVLYQEVTRVKTGGGNESSNNPAKKNPLDTHDFVRNGHEIDSQVKVTAPEQKYVEPEIVTSTVSNHLSHYNHDDDVNDFKEHFGEVDNSEVVDVVPENFVPVESINNTLSDEDNALSPGDAILEYERQAELERQNKEAILRERTAQANRRNKVKSVVKTNKNTDDNKSATSHLKEFPTDLANRAKMLFPEATTMNDAVAAYMYLKEGKPSDLDIPEHIKNIADTYIGETVTVKDAQDELIKEMVQLKAYDRAIAQKLETLELAIVYALFDHIGFRRNDQSSPGTVDFLEQGVTDLINRLEKQSQVKQMRDAQRNGRPIR